MPAPVRRGVPHRCGAPALWGHGVPRERPAEAPQMSGNAPCSAMMHPTNSRDIIHLHKFLGMTSFPKPHTSKCACGGPRFMVHPKYCFIKLGYWNFQLETWVWDLELGMSMLHTRPGDIFIPPPIARSSLTNCFNMLYDVPMPRSSLTNCFNMLIASNCMTLRLDIVWRSLDPGSCDLERRTGTFKFEFGILQFEYGILTIEVWISKFAV